MGILRKKIRTLKGQHTGPIEDRTGPGFTRPIGQSYEQFFTRLHANRLFNWYLEIGCRTGTTFQPVRSKTIAIDPYFQVTTNVIQEKPSLLIFQQTSDDFFASGFLKSTGITPDFCFLDGMHLIEFLLRDFINCEAAMTTHGVIAVHDCVPYNLGMTTRDLENLPNGSWTGDVWKLIPILRKYRPDLRVEVLNCAPTGLVLISNLNPTDATLSNNLDTILTEWQERAMEDYGVSTFFDTLDLQDAEAFLTNGVEIFDAITIAAEHHKSPTYVTP